MVLSLAAFTLLEPGSGAFWPRKKKKKKPFYTPRLTNMEISAVVGVLVADVLFFNAPFLLRAQI